MSQAFKKRIITSVFFAIALALAAAALVVRAPLARTALLVCGCASAFFACRLLCAQYPAHSVRIMRGAFWAFFAAYLALLAYFMLFDDGYGRLFETFSGYSLKRVLDYAREYANPVPFKNIILIAKKYAAGIFSRRFVLRNYLGNILAFAPFALFLPLLFKRAKGFWGFFLGLSIAIVVLELLQLVLLRGYTDIDDYILNAGGACIAYAVLHIPKIRAFVGRLTLLEY